MKIIYLKKQRGRIYSSESIIPGLTHGENGEPMLDGAYVSVSDTPLHWAACIAEHPVGFDIEESSRVVNARSAKALHPLEQKYLAAVEAVSSEWRAEFLALWTAKESYMKFCGAGLRLGASSFSVVGDDLAFSEIIQKKGYPAARLIRLDAPRGITAALCVPADEGGRGADDRAPCRMGGSDGEDDMGSFRYPGSIPWERIEYDAPFKISALEKAAGYLDAKAYASAELRLKLKKDGYPDEDADAAICELESRGYISDEDYARAYAERSRDRGKGRLRIRRELLQKGIGRELIDGALESGDEEGSNEFDRALAAALKTAPDVSEEKDRTLKEKQLAKIGRRLAALGFESSVIYAVFDRLRG